MYATGSEAMFRMVHSILHHNQASEPSKLHKQTYKEQCEAGLTWMNNYLKYDPIRVLYEQ